jgi:predicted branched-subunit amino acid permease
MFIAIIIPPARKEKSVLIAILMAVAASYIFAYVPGLDKISGGWSVIIITVVVSAIAAVLFPVADKEGE